MANPLSDRARPQELAERGQAFDFKGKISDFRRLVEIVEADLERLSGDELPREWQSAPVDIRLGFAWADSRQEIPTVEGEISTEIAAVCQRCLEPFRLPLETRLRLLLLKSGEAPSAPGDFEVWEIEGDAIRPIDIVEEALIMALPMSVMHASRKLCGPLADSVADDIEETVRPFDNLRSLMNDTNN